jgi:hypothetical protein
LRSIFVEGDGRILAVGTAGSGAAAANLLAGRLTSQGAADTTFGQGGFATFDVTPGATNWGGDQGFFVAQLADGKILLAGQGASESTNADFIAARLIGDQFATINGRILTVAGSAAADAISLTFTASSVNAVLNGSTASFDLGDFDSIQIDAGAANDALTISAPAAIAQPLSFIGGAGSNTLSINSGVLAIANDLGQSSSSTAVSVASGATVTFAASEHLIGLDVSGTAVLGANGTSRLVTSSLSIAAGGLLDLGDNDLLLDYTGASQLAAVQQLINAARTGGSWTGKGLGSSAARNSPQHNTTLGAMESSEYQSIYGPGASFDGEPLDATMILAKYTWYGDADFNGRVNFDDYVHIDSGFNNHRSGWTNGDFDGNGQVNFDDYVLIDLAFNTQSGTL